MNDINVLIGHTHRFDRRLFFGPLDREDTFVKLPPAMTLPQLLKTLGVYESTSQATRAGFKGPIPEGYSEHQVQPPGKPWKKGTLAILKCSQKMKLSRWLSLWQNHLLIGFVSKRRNARKIRTNPF